MNQGPTANVFERVEALEKANRRYRLFNAFLLSVILIVFIAAARAPFVDGVMIRDRDGRDRAGMWVDEQDKRHAVMEMIDDGGNVRYWTSLEPNGAVNTVYRDSRGQQRIMIGVDGEDRVVVRLLDAQGRVFKDLTQ